MLDKLRLEVLAPPNYRFSASCLVSQGEVTRFTRCNGNNNKAELETSSNSIHGPQDGDLPIPVVLQVINPPIHSDSTEINSWRLQLFRGAETQPSNVGTTAGYKIQSMTASYIGNNRLGGAGSSFFKFKPNQMMPTGGSLQIVPPQPQGIVSYIGIFFYATADYLGRFRDREPPPSDVDELCSSTSDEGGERSRGSR